MEKVTLYVKKILALIFSFSIAPLAVLLWELDRVLLLAPGLPLAFLIFSVLTFRISGEKPKYLFGLTQSDAHLTKKGGFWNLFKWIVNTLGFVYDIVVWTVWGVYQLFLLIIDLIMLVKFIVYWIIHAIIWFIRQLFPPFIFIFKMFMHYIINWFWWIYQMTFRNMRISVNKNFYFIALWGAIPAIFIVFLFIAISQIAGIPELAAISGLFAIVPIVWSYGEISALRYEEREKDDYTSVRYKFRNGWDAVKSVLFYLILAIVLVIAEIALNMAGWIPNLSMSLFGISLNLNMAISLVLVFLAIVISFADSMLPTHILYHPEHENNLNSSLVFLKVIGQKFLRYIIAAVPPSFFGAVLLAIPVLVMSLAFGLTETVKDGVMDVKIENLTAKEKSQDALEAYRTAYKVDRLEIYKEIPENAAAYFTGLRGTCEEVESMKQDILESEEQLVTRKAEFDQQMASLGDSVASAQAIPDALAVTRFSNERLSLEEEYLVWENHQKECIAFLEVDLKEQRSQRIQMPILYLFVGVMISIFGGLVLAVLLAYMGNVVFELYDMREDDKPTYWRQVINELKEKNGNQPLLGFTFLAVIIVFIWIFGLGGLGIF